MLTVIIVPLLGILVYLIARGDKMTERTLQREANQDAEFREYVRDTAAEGGGGTAAELEKLHDLHDKGVLNDDDYASAKAKALRE